MAGIQLNGNWKAGWAIDLHTTDSTLCNGHFDTTRSEIGESLYQLKYHNDYSQIPVLVKKTVTFLNTRKVTPYLKAIIPIPPSNSNRTRQPVLEIAKCVSKSLNIPSENDYIEKVRSTEQLKGVSDPSERKKIIEGAFEVLDCRYKNKKVLLFDDLYRSGSTLNEVTKILYQNGQVQNVYVLTLTKTRVKR